MSAPGPISAGYVLMILQYYCLRVGDEATPAARIGGKRPHSRLRRPDAGNAARRFHRPQAECPHAAPRIAEMS